MLEILSEGIGFGFLILFPGPSFITKIYNIIEVTIRINMIIDIIIIIFFFFDEFSDNFFGLTLRFSMFEIVCCILSKESV